MNTTLIPSFLAALAISMAAPLRAEAAVSPVFQPEPSGQAQAEITVDTVAARIQANGDRVTRGTTRIMVSMRLGSPNAVSADGAWFYRGYTARSLVENSNRVIHQPTQPGTLIVRFRDGKVTSLSLADTFSPESSPKS